MARKSRKETAAVAAQEADAACRAAIYVRLSVEDTHTHSVSIETQQMIIARYLEQYPEISVYDTYMHVTRAVDGQDAVACFANNPADTYDVILMDVLMPKMNGHQAARAIRAMSKERPDAAKIPIIAQSANAFKEDVQASLDSGMNGHISKPFNIDAVTTAIKQNIKR